MMTEAEIQTMVAGTAPPGPPERPAPLVIATILREDGTTGVDTHVRELRQFLCEHGGEAPLVTPFSWGRWLAVPIFGARLAVEPLSRSWGVAWYRYWHTAFLEAALRRHLSRTGPAVVYAQGPEAAMAALRARRGRHQRVVMAVHYQGSQADGWAVRGYIAPEGRAYQRIRAMEREVAARVDGVVYVSRSAQEHILQWLPELAAVPSTVVSNFVRPVQAPGGPPLGDLVTVGVLERDKNQEFLLRVLAAAKRAGRAYTLDIFGEGQLRRGLERAASDMGVEGQVRFRGFQPHVREMLPRYRAYVHASAVETGPIAVIEAMAAGLPVLAVGEGGVTDLMEDGVEGKFWPRDDEKEAAEVLIDLLEDEAERAEAGRAALGRFHRCFDTAAVAPRLLAFLQQPATGNISAGQRVATSVLPGAPRPSRN